MTVLALAKRPSVGEKLFCPSCNSEDICVVKSIVEVHDLSTCKYEHDQNNRGKILDSIALFHENEERPSWLLPKNIEVKLKNERSLLCGACGVLFAVPDGVVIVEDWYKRGH